MITFVIPQHAQVISVNGKAEHILEQDSQSLESGYEIAAGDKIEITSGAQVVLKYADGSEVIIDEHFKATDNADTSDVAMDVLDEITEDSDQSISEKPQVSDDVLAEISAIQDLILSDEEFIDPVSTAAGSASDGGRSSAISVARTGDETLAHAEFETKTFTQSGQNKVFVDTSMTDANAFQTVHAPVAADGTATTEENTELAGQVPAATDVDGSVVSYQLATDVNAGEGSLNFNADGSYTFTPGSDFDNLAEGTSQDVTFMYTATDNDSGVSEAKTITITVTGTNDVPVAADATASATENTELAGQVPVATDVDGIVESYQLVDDVSEGSLSFNADGNYTFTPGDDFDDLAVNDSRDVTFTYTATDNDSGVSAEKTITITVTGSNDAATVSTETKVVSETDALISTGGTLTSADVDNVDNAFTASTTSGTNGDFTIGTDGVWTFTANAAFNELNVGQNVTETFNVTSVDGTPSTVTVQINGSNDAASVANIYVGMSEMNAPLTTGGTLTATDIDNIDNIFTAIKIDGNNGSFELAESGEWTFTANSAFDELNVGDNVIESFTVTTVDGTPRTVTVSIQGTNDAPVLGDITKVVIEGDAAISGQLSAVDPDNNSTATFSITSGVSVPAGFVLNTDGSYSFDPTNDAYDYLKANDSVELIIPVTVTD